MQGDFGFVEGGLLKIPTLDSSNFFRVCKIYEGGMGICLKIENTKTAECFALKGIKGEISRSKEFSLRFLKELKLWFAASSFNGVVEAQAFVRINGILYVVAEWVGGGDLRGALNILSSRDKLRIAVEITDTLRVMHEKYQIIHRDLKPENILLADNGRALVSDLGLAKIYGEACSQNVVVKNKKEDFALTAVGSYMGTCCYMSPEQIKDSSSVDFRSDIYALGCIFFEMETGEPPFRGDDVVSILRAHLYNHPKKLGGIFKKTHTGLEKIISKCLEKKAEERYQSYEDLLKDLLYVATKRFPGFSYGKLEMRYHRRILGDGYSEFLDLMTEGATNGFYNVFDFDDLRPFLEEAMALSQMHRYDEAIKILKYCSIPELVSNGMRWNIACEIIALLAHTLVLNGDSKEAFHLFKRLEISAEKPVEFYLNYSQCLLNLDEHYENFALSLVEKGLSISCNDIDLLANKTICLLRLQQIDEALQTARKRYSLDKNSLSATLLLSKVLEEASIRIWGISLKCYFNLISERLDILLNASHLNPSREDFLLEVVRAIRDVDKSEALFLIQKLIEVGSFSKFGKILAGVEWASALKGYYENSSPEFLDLPMEKLESVIDLWKKNGVQISAISILENIYNVFLRMTCGLDVKCLSYLIDYHNSNVLELDSGDSIPQNPIELVKIYYRKNELKKAVEVLEEIPENRVCFKSNLGFYTAIPYRKQEWYRMYVLILLKMGMAEKALFMAKRVVGKMPENADAHDTMAIVFRDIGMKEEEKKAREIADNIFEEENNRRDSLRPKMNELIKALNLF